MEIDRRELKKIFEKLKVQETDGTKHVRGWVVENDELLFPIHYSHAKPLNGHVAHEFRKSLFLDVRELALFIRCDIPRSTVIERAQQHNRKHH